MGTFRDKAIVLSLAVSALLLTGMGTKQATGGKEATLTASDEALAVQIGFEPAVLRTVKELAPVPIHRLTGYDPNGYQIIVNGIAFSVPEQNAERVLSSLRQRLLPRTYMVFSVAVNEVIKTEEIGILKGTDQYDILRTMQTNGEERGIATDDIIERLKGWEKRHPFEIIGAENGWVEIEFKTVPRDLEAFAEEVSDFCPDAVEDDTAGIEELIKGIRISKRLFLSWDR